MSLLSIIQRACPRLGLSKPNSVVGNTDQQVLQLLELANEEGEDLASRYPWQALVRENTFTFALASSQGAMNGSVVSDGDFDSLVNDTIWNRTISRPIVGPTGSVRRQYLGAFPVTGPFEEFWIKGGILYIDPAPTSADTGAFEYKSTWWCESSGGDGQATWQADNDVGRLDETLMRLGLIWRWKQVKGLDYQQEFETYEMRVADAMAKDGGKPKLRLDDCPDDAVPGIIVPAGNWNL